MLTSMLVLVVIYLSLGTFKNLGQAVCIRRRFLDYLLVTKLLLVAAGIILPAYSLLFLDPDLANISLIWPFFLITLPCFVIGAALEIKGLRYLEAGLHTIVSTLTVLFITVLLAWWLLSESLYGWEWLGLALISLGVIVTYSTGRRNRQLTRGLLYMLLASSLLSLGLVVDKHMISSVGLATFMVYGPGSLGIAAAIFYPLWRRYHGSNFSPKMNTMTISLLIAITTAYAIKLALYFIILLAFDNVAYVNTLIGASFVLTVILSYLFLGERGQGKAKILGSTLAIVGVAFLT